MAIEGISGAGMIYQGSVSTAEMKAETQPKVENASNEIASNEIAKDTMSLTTNETDTEGNDSSANKQYQQNSAQIKKAIDEINKNAGQQEAVYGIHEETGRVTIKMVDKKTKEVIKEFPPEKTLDMIAKVWEMAGLLVDEKR